MHFTITVHTLITIFCDLNANHHKSPNQISKDSYHKPDYLKLLEWKYMKSSKWKRKAVMQMLYMSINEYQEINLEYM
jgi:hypothetical protein